ncbi:hypothetical protein COW36_16415 [bacterium (Candidatus Blackallbacteria) CG17_big_fil_post_rev_8_21_14_2_50_48_46]|uniref:TPM domain-containing protein n=1 Tax=bacterium (Candidatus Blackallbacteria) CG17_big_fil_post_rev_8_21_14_2_50_48_46 TaxID=2014261 RepID=A0A2M7G224_9BACT|nr:MAG: hypothetical protein COW64_07025 [bacterium (Candidatus Blackallbacteria) CG18_big_fil_WC_8_21_14_2_50_49_26]PIW15620.1 MAG: hypothetical protein COW36_16415 [bacterium (Candidatus Blackallbacteria) CG17_big_fil_post_rev_8_21_14_2_50_48_46]PIW48104.1 MAG: hypothetical protein COW20_10570 [bacterium (Candidatus Blackallbacteria) CG13_big_fil_rev_8_21_14_2_50_49_14]
MRNTSKTIASFAFKRGCLSVFILVLLSLFFPAQAQSGLPSPNPHSPLTDLSGTLSPEYLSAMSARLERYPFEVRALYLAKTQNLQLAFYAEKLFKAWKMPPKSMLMVVALDRRKIGLHLGSELRNELRQVPPSEMPMGLKKNEQSSASQPQTTASAEPSENEHLDRLPEVIEEISQSLQKQNKQAQQEPPQSAASRSENLLESNINESKPLKRQENFSPRQLLPVYIFLGILLFTGLFFLGFRLWQKRQAQEALIDKFSLEGQAAFNEIEMLYAKFDGLLPNFHKYQGDTREKLKLFLQEVSALQNQYDDIFDNYEEEVKALAHQQEQADAIDFFLSLEKGLEKGQKLFQQAQTILKNLTDLNRNNQNQLESLQTQKHKFSQELHELRKLHPQLKLTKLSPVFQRHHEQLQEYESLNSKDPMRVEKQIQEWLKELRKLEREIQSLPHLWLQFHQDLRQRIEGLKQRAAQKKLTPAQTRQLEEVQQLHKNILQAIENGDMERMNHLNESFTHRLQGLESEI